VIKKYQWGPINIFESPLTSGQKPYELPNFDILNTLEKFGGNLYFIAIFIYVEFEFIWGYIL
jgi:hypothetical protein